MRFIGAEVQEEGIIIFVSDEVFAFVSSRFGLTTAKCLVKLIDLVGSYVILAPSCGAIA